MDLLANENLPSYGEAAFGTVNYSGVDSGVVTGLAIGSAFFIVMGIILFGILVTYIKNKNFRIRVNRLLKKGSK